MTTYLQPNALAYTSLNYDYLHRRGLRRAALFVLWVVLSIAAGQQWFGASPDLVNYLDYYYTITPYFDFAGSRFEYGFQFFAWVWASFGFGYYSLYVILAGISLGIKFFLFDRYLSSPLLAAVSYCLAFYLLHEYTQIRAAVGISFALLGVHSLLERKRLLFTLFTIAGFLFHYSTIVISLIALGSLGIKGRGVFALGALGLLAGSAMLPMIQEFIIDTFSSLNPLTTAYIYNDQNSEIANIFSFTSVMALGVIIWSLLNPEVFRSNYTKTFFTMVLVSYFSLVLLRDSLELALRLRDALAVGTVFLIFREPIAVRQITPIVLWLASAAYLYYNYSTTQVLI